MALSEIVGHVRQLEVLKKSLARGAVAPAYLFHGPAGVGKMKTALEFARSLLCSGEGVDACGLCDSCRRVGGGAHPDMILVSPEKRVLKIEQIRGIQEFLFLTPSRGVHKVAVLDAAEKMNAESANALLKTLEEPPPGAVIILVAANPGALPGTVLSRCRRVSFGALEETQVAEILRHHGWSEEDAAAGSALAEGSPAQAIGMQSESRRRALATLEVLLRGVADGDRGGVFAAAEGFSGEREEAELVLQLLQAILRRQIRSRLGLPGGAADPLGIPLPEIDTGGLQALAGNLAAAQRLLAGNVNVKLALGSFFGDWIGAAAERRRER